MLPFFEHSALRAVTGDTIRPGGFMLTDRAIVFCGLPERSRVLDVGCGTGATVTRLCRKYRLDAFGLDTSDWLLREGRGRDSDVPLVMAMASSLPIGDETLAAVFCECVLSLTSNPPAVLHEFYRTLRSGGSLILSDLYFRSPEHPSDLNRLPVQSCLSGAMAQSEIEAIIKDNGFRILLWEDHSALLKELTVRLIFAGGSLQSLLGGMCPSPYSSSFPPAVLKAKPGYYLLIAEKGAR